MFFRRAGALVTPSRYPNIERTFYGIDTTYSRDPSSRRWTASLGLQPQLGLRPERRIGNRIAHRGNFDAHGTAVTTALGIDGPLP
jgi:hypothetical protein